MVYIPCPGATKPQQRYKALDTSAITRAAAVQGYVQALLTALLLHVNKLHLAQSLGVHVQTMGIFCAATAFADMLAASADTTLAGA